MSKNMARKQGKPR